jgi:hypothetical protein
VTFGFEEPFRLYCGHAPRTGCSDRLPVGPVLNIAGVEYACDISPRTAMRHDVAVWIEI